MDGGIHASVLVLLALGPFGVLGRAWWCGCCRFSLYRSSNISRTNILKMGTLI